MATYVVQSPIVVEVLRNDNYENWRCCIKSHLLAQGLWDIVEPTTRPSNDNNVAVDSKVHGNEEVAKVDSHSNSDNQEGARADTTASVNHEIAEAYSKAPDNQGGAQANSKKDADDQEAAKVDSKALDNQEGAQTNSEAWCKRNAAALHAIQISCSPDILSKIRNIDSAKKAWDTLANMQKLPEVHAGPVQNEYAQWLELNKRAYGGNWDSVKRFLDDHPTAINAKITAYGATVLHVATFFGNVQVVEKLVDLMSSEDLEIVDVYGDTALSYAANEGMTKMAKCMIRKNKNLVDHPNREGRIPVVASCSRNHKELTHYLYRVTPLEVLNRDNGCHGSLLLQYSIVCKMLDIALDLLYHFPSLATALDHIDRAHAVFRLARMPDLFPSGSRIAFWQNWIYSCIQIGPLIACRGDRMHSVDQSQSESEIIVQQALARPHNPVVNLLKFLGIKQIYDMKLNHVYSAELLRRMCEHISTLDVEKINESRIYRSFIEAIKNGIVEFIVKMVEVYPSVMDSQDNHGRNMFAASIAYRQEKVFSLFYGFEGGSRSIISDIDKIGNNMLHWAGALSPPTQLTRISGAALQMQREMQWYQEVDSIVNPIVKNYRNQNGDTPGQLFTQSHQKLMADGEKWMKETATSSTVVGALIITVMFTAAFTVPGGNKDTGFPVFLHNKSFMTFIISDAISLFSSSTSVLMFLGILTSRYSEKDFLISLPTKLVIGLSMLFISIATMMVAFCAALIIVLDGELKVVIPISLLAGIPVTLFILLQFPLLVEIFMSTYGPGIFNRKMKRWY